jgi:hypothetical protein
MVHEVFLITEIYTIQNVRRKYSVAGDSSARDRTYKLENL